MHRSQKLLMERRWPLFPHDLSGICKNSIWVEFLIHLNIKFEMIILLGSLKMEEDQKIVLQNTFLLEKLLTNNMFP